MSVKLLTEHHLQFLSSKGVCTGSSEFTLVKMPHCWKSHVTAHILYIICKDWITYVKVGGCRFGYVELVMTMVMIL